MTENAENAENTENAENAENTYVYNNIEEFINTISADINYAGDIIEDLNNVSYIGLYAERFDRFGMDINDLKAFNNLLLILKKRNYKTHDCIENKCIDFYKKLYNDRENQTAGRYWLHKYTFNKLPQILHGSPTDRDYMYHNDTISEFAEQYNNMLILAFAINIHIIDDSFHDAIMLFNRGFKQPLHTLIQLSKQISADPLLDKINLSVDKINLSKLKIGIILYNFILDFDDDDSNDYQYTDYLINNELLYYLNNADFEYIIFEKIRDESANYCLNHILKFWLKDARQSYPRELKLAAEVAELRAKNKILDDKLNKVKYLPPDIAGKKYLVAKNNFSANKN